MALEREQTVVALDGALDVTTAEALVGAVGELRGGGAGHVVLDLSGVELIDSVGLRTLLTLRNDAKRGGLELTLIPPPAAAGRIFDLTVTRSLFDWSTEARAPGR
jgi:anti-anti-sigma factor